MDMDTGIDIDDTDIDKRRLIIGIGWHNYGGEGVPQSTLCKRVESQGSQWYNSEYRGLRGADDVSLSPKPPEWETRGEPQAESKGQSSRSTGVWGQEGIVSQLKHREQRRPPFAFLFCSRPQCTDEGDLNSMLNSSRNTPIDTLRNNVLPAILVSFSPVKLTRKTNRHI